MEYFKSLDKYTEKSPSVLTIGKFDGLHKGHMLLIDKIKSLKADNTLVSAVCSMDFEPLWKAKDITPSLIMTKAERAQRLEGQVDYLCDATFDEKFMSMDAETFIREIIVNTFHAVFVVVGDDFHFGYRKRGDVNVLKSFQEQYGYRTIIVKKMMYGEREVSSTYIKELIEEGDMPSANKLLGYNYGYKGIVEYGNRIGRTLGFPTLNVYPARYKLLPPFGVYVVRVRVRGTWYRGIANIGVKPTIKANNDVLIESYMFDYEGDAYGEEVDIELLDYHRAEKKFASLDEMKKHVNKDIEYGKKFFTREVLS